MSKRNRWYATGIVFAFSGLALAQGPPHNNPKPASDPGAGSNILGMNPNGSNAAIGTNGNVLPPGGASGGLGDPNVALADLQAGQLLDQQFIQRAAMDGMTQVQLGRLASEKAGSDSVKQLGVRILEEVAKSTAELKGIAGKESITIPESLDSKHQEWINRLGALSGADFDRAFLQTELKSRERLVKDYQVESQQGTSPMLREFTSRNLPKMQERLQIMKELNKRPQP